jgi:hypothetical protein
MSAQFAQLKAANGRPSMWVPTVFTKNRERLLKHAIAENFFGRVSKLAEPHLSDEHFTVEGTLIEAWASQKSFRRKDGSDDGDGGELPRDTAQERHGTVDD